MFKSKFYIFGAIAAALYVITVIVGGLLWPGYSHVSQAISELTYRQAPNLALMQPLFWLYNLSLLACAAGMFLSVSTKVMRTSAVFLGLCALSGIMMFFFPQDPLHTTLTVSGLLHLIFAGTASVATLLAVSFAAAGTWKDNRSLAIFSWVIFGIIMASGPITATAPTKLPHYFGIAERVTIGSFILWLFVYFLSLGRKNPKKKTSII